MYWEHKKIRTWHWSDTARLWGIFLWQRACTALENSNRQTMAFPQPIKPEGASEFTIWLSMCTTFVKFTLLISFLSFKKIFLIFSVLPCHYQSLHPSSCSNRNLHFSWGCFSPFCFCLPTVANNSSFLVSIAIRHQKHSALRKPGKSW